MNLKYKPTRKTYSLRLKMGLLDECRKYGIDVNHQIEMHLESIIKMKQKAS